jgi:ubiquinone/menaquinone biosynthesis C-methylase UbiE
LTLTAPARRDLGEMTDLAALERILPLRGIRAVDVGCGPGKVTRELCASGATVLGVEPDPIQAEKNRAAPPEPNLSFIEARAESLPVPDASVDAVFFFRSLHHVPKPQMDAALTEAARVLKPEAGLLWVVEPGMDGTHFPMMRPFHDETAVRTAAQAALRRTAAVLFETEEQLQYLQLARYQDFAALVTRVTGQTFNAINRDRVESDEVRRLFEAAKTAAGDYVFTQPTLVNVYRRPKRSQPRAGH